MFSPNLVRDQIMAQFTFNNKQTLALLEAIQTTGNQLMFVKDSGVYLMVRRNEGGSVTEYARGLNPDKNPNCYEDAMAKLGGDDIVEYLGTDVAQHLPDVKARKMKLVIKVTARTMSVNLST